MVYCIVLRCMRSLRGAAEAYRDMLWCGVGLKLYSSFPACCRACGAAEANSCSSFLFVVQCWV
jgi:hypothetical protein